MLWCAAGTACFVCPAWSQAFNPKDLDHLEFFVESIRGLAVTTNNSQEAYEAQNEFTRLEMCFADTARFPHGCIRWWEDQSPYRRTKERACPFTGGRDFGQDDHDKPGYIPDGCNGKPCARGGPIGDRPGEHKQPCYFETQAEQGFSTEGPFSAFLLARPVSQEEDFVYYGAYHWGVLRHRVSDDSLHFKVGKQVALTGPGAVRTGRWQLIEVHREADNNLQAVVNGVDVTEGAPNAEGRYRFGYLFNNNKGQGEPAPMYGDIAAMIVYSDELTEAERSAVRGYLDGIYGFMGKGSSDPE